MNNRIKILVKEEWLKDFPTLSAYAQNKLYKVIGPFIYGIELIKLPRVENYRPHFTIYPLFKVNVTKCLVSPLLIDEFYNEKGNQIDLPYEENTERLHLVQNIIKNSSKLSFDLDTYQLSDLFRIVNSYLYDHPDVLYKIHSGKRAMLFELKFHGALYVYDKDLIMKTLSEIEEESKNWNMKPFEMWYGKFDLWLHALQEKVSHSDEFFKQIEANKQDKKISKLKSSALIV